jgi:hypothetical protein
MFACPNGGEAAECSVPPPRSNARTRAKSSGNAKGFQKVIVGTLIEPFDPVLDCIASCEYEN